MPKHDLHTDPNLASAWAPWFAHEYITYYTVGVIEELMALAPVPVTANPRYGGSQWPIGPRHVDIYKESYQERRQLDPFTAFDHKKRNGDFAHVVMPGKAIEPWKLLVLYSTEPDYYVDEDLLLHKNQKMAGGSRGWRHMHFRMLGSTYGIAPQSFRVHKDLAALAFENGNPYWGWRYLTRAGHYLADLGAPFHVKVMPGFFLLSNLLNRSKIFRTASTLHQSYEIYVERRFREGLDAFGLALQKGAREGRASGLPIAGQLPGYIERARKRHNALFYYLYDQFGAELMDAFWQTNESHQIDAAVQNNKCFADAAGVIFSEANRARLDFLDRVTILQLTDVGRMLGGLFAGFALREGRGPSAAPAGA
ncbi:MAG: hypothetical protein EG826_08255 [Deltaproteobacteria bacterium]|nr:hypothetical protein [Deltaproteobacteria bacterium]